MNWIKQHTIIFIGLFLFNFSYSQETTFSSIGVLPLVNYTGKEYKGSAQMFDITQDNHGLIYFVNQKGVVVFNGVNWSKIELPNKIEPTNIELDLSGNLIIGSSSGLWKTSKNELGEYLTKETKLFKNLKIYYSKTFFSNHIIELNNKVVIIDSTNNMLYEYVGEELSSSNVINDVFFFKDSKKGIIKYEDGKFKSFLNNPIIEVCKISKVEEFNGQLYVITDIHGVYRIEKDHSLTQVYYNPKVNYLSSLVINEDMISLGTFGNGIEILDRDFNLKYTVTPEKGLINGGIKQQFLDKEGNLWLATNNGISKVDVFSPILSYQNVYSESTIEAISFYNQELVLATGGGSISILDDGVIRKNTSIANDCYGQQELVFNEDTSLYISALYNLYKYNGDNRAESLTEGGPYMVRQSPLDQNDLFVLHYDGIQKLRYENGKFTEVGYIRNFSKGEPFNFEIEKDGTIWIGTKPNDGIYSTHVDVFGKPKIGFQRFYTEEGIPEGTTYISMIDDEVFFGTSKGIIKYDYLTDLFTVNTEWGYDFIANPRSIHRFNQDKKGNIWISMLDETTEKWEIGYAEKNAKGSFIWHPESFYKYDDFAIHDFYHQDSNVTWLAGTGSLLRYEKRATFNTDFIFNATLRTVSIGRDTIFGGFGLPVQDKSFAYNLKKPIHFYYASNSFKDEAEMLYSYKLEGYDSNWSPWEKKYDKDYTLTEGAYTFMVKAKSFDKKESQIAQYSFSVLPPWFRTWWAYLLFSFLALVFIFIIIRLSLYRIKKKNLNLERIVEERTQEVVAQKSEAEKQRDLVAEKNHEITDSINYAKRLQDAILTPIELIEDVFRDSFIYYLPKDIVAGDFYWTNFAKYNNRSKGNLIAVADCTGHGVPGALVSVVCSNALDRAHNEYKLTCPGEILDKTTEIVVETFDKAGDNVKDGMDIALCSYIREGEHVKLMYAGANNPLWVVTKKETLTVNESEIEPILNHEGYNLFEIKGSKQPIGKYDRIIKFKSHKVILNEGDTVYTFTDGYADQFGGPKGKKYKYKPFKRFILSIQEENMKAQSQLISKEFEDWKDALEQIDDVCVLGIRI